MNSNIKQINKTVFFFKIEILKGIPLDERKSQWTNESPKPVNSVSLRTFSIGKLCHAVYSIVNLCHFRFYFYSFSQMKEHLFVLVILLVEVRGTYLFSSTSLLEGLNAEFSSVQTSTSQL